MPTCTVLGVIDRRMHAFNSQNDRSTRTKRRGGHSHRQGPNWLVKFLDESLASRDWVGIGIISLSCSDKQPSSQLPKRHFTFSTFDDSTYTLGPGACTMPSLTLIREGKMSLSYGPVLAQVTSPVVHGVGRRKLLMRFCISCLGITLVTCSEPDPSLSWAHYGLARYYRSWVPSALLITMLAGPKYAES
jgi:hypothetical protein